MVQILPLNRFLSTFSWPRSFFIRVFGKMTSQIPVTVILGATGTGKSKLAIEVAKKFNGEVISADSMQVYRGLDIVTNKVMLEEMDGVKHHVIDYVEPLNAYTVLDFRNVALTAINTLLEQGKMPIIVGGTNYYIESLLWKVLVDEESFYNITKTCINTRGSSPIRVDADVPKEINLTDDYHPFYSVYQPDLRFVSNSEIYEQLLKVDSEMAELLHPNDRRKVLRSLEVFEESGYTHSDLIKQQKSVDGGSSLGGPLRFPNSCIIWLQCEQSVLDKRLDDRVDEMMKRGLIAELLDFHNHYNKQRLTSDRATDPDYTKGIFQCIGFKEFKTYLHLDDDSKALPESQKLLEEGIELLKQVTKRYARKQIKWIKNRFLSYPDRQVPPVYALDTTDLEQWNSGVHNTAITLLSALMKNEVPSIATVPRENVSVHGKRKCMSCQICNKTMLGDNQWAAHVKSRTHKKLMQQARKLENLNANSPITL